MESTPEKRKPGRPPATYKAGEGAPKKSVRLEGDLLAFVEAYPGGLKGVVEFAYNQTASGR